MAVKKQACNVLTLVCLFLSIVLQKYLTFAEDLKWDDNGYVLYCPCMGNSFFVADIEDFCILI